MRNGCAHMRQAFDIKSINLDSLIATALDDPKAVGADIKAFHGINFADLNTAYHRFCKNEAVDKPVVDLGTGDRILQQCGCRSAGSDAHSKGRKLPSLSVVLDGTGQGFADMFEPGNRRVWVPLADIPDYVQKAFVAAEDRRFFQHHGVDQRGIIRAFIGNLADTGAAARRARPITQQLVKNLLVGEDVTYERKIREMIVASRLENTLSKQEILELYLDSAYLGRGSWACRWPPAVTSANRRRILRSPKAPCWPGCSRGRAISIPTAILIAPSRGSLTCSAACKKTA